MVRRYDDVSPQQQADQAIRQASHEYVERCRQDPVYMAWLRDQIAVIDAAPPAPRLQPGQLLEQVEARLADGPPEHRTA